jgi:AcrR family transcriptional regulator
VLSFSSIDLRCGTLTGMNASRTARERVRAELTREIKDEARRQLASGGAQALSLRAVARELGMVSSALYRYFPSRDDLLTALIVDAYDSLGAAAEAAGAGQLAPRARWHAVCGAVREWALRHPHEYALLYGSPVPGYQAPVDTVAPANRVTLALLGVLREGWNTGAIIPASESPALSATLARQVAEVSAAVAPELPGPLLARAIIAWSQLFGMISFELFGQFVGSVDPSADFFTYAAGQMADFVGLRKLPPGA